MDERIAVLQKFTMHFAAEYTALNFGEKDTLINICCAKDLNVATRHAQCQVNCN